MRTRGSTRLLERRHETRRLRAVLAAARTGRGGFALVEGPAGVGKSRLLDWTIKQARQEEMLVLTARSGESERDFSFGVVLQLLERRFASMASRERSEALAGAAELAAPVFELRQSEGESPRERSADTLLHGLFWLVANLATRRPLLLAVDDLHWSDPVSLRFLLYLVQRIDGLPVALIATRRPRLPDAQEPTGAPIADALAAHTLTERVSPAPLSAHGVARLLGDAFGAPIGERFVGACMDATGGNPFLVQAVIRALQDDGIEPTEENSERIELLRPADVRQQVLVRISRLGRAAVGLASAASILGDGALLADAAALAGLDLQDAAGAADALATADVLASAMPISFAHPLVRSSVYEAIPAARRSRDHLRAAALLVERALPETVAAHLLRSSRSGEAWALNALRRAVAHALAEGNPESAIHYLSRALREPLDGRDRGHLLLELGSVGASVGDVNARRHIDQALVLIDDPRTRARAYQVLGTVLYRRGDYAAAAGAFEHGLEQLASADDPLARDLHAGYYSAASLDVTLASRALEHIEPLLERPVGEETAAERAVLASLAVRAATSGAPREEAIALAERAWGGGALLDDEGPEGWAWSLVTGALTWVDEPERSLEIAGAVIERARREGLPMAYATASFCAQGAAWTAGDLREAGAYGEAALAARDSGWRSYATAAAGVQAHILIDQAELAAAETMLETGDEPAAGRSIESALTLSVRGRLRLLHRRPREALADFLAAGEICDRFGGGHPLAPWRVGAALAAARLGDRARAIELLDVETSLVERSGVPTAIARALRARARMVEGERSVDVLHAALAVFDGVPPRRERLVCLAEFGAALRRSGRRADARKTLYRALELAHDAGAWLIERQVRDELKIAGARPRRFSFSGPDALTASERRVAVMAATGASNREIAQELFVTTRTVEQHLYNTFRKLGIRSRRELPNALAGTASPV